MVLYPHPSQVSAVFVDSRAEFARLPTGSRIEISPEGWNVMQHVTQHIGEHGGAALVVDYGEDYVQGDTLRVCAGAVVSVVEIAQALVDRGKSSSRVAVYRRL